MTGTEEEASLMDTSEVQCEDLDMDEEDSVLEVVLTSLAGEEGDIQ